MEGEIEPMPTFAELSKQYADKIRTALSQDGFTKAASVNYNAVRISRAAAAFKEIATDLKR